MAYTKMVQISFTKGNQQMTRNFYSRTTAAKASAALRNYGWRIGGKRLAFKTGSSGLVGKPQSMRIKMVKY